MNPRAQQNPTRQNLPGQNTNRQQSGFTTLEMLLAMAVLGIILTIAANLLQTNQKVTDAQQARTTSLEDARLAASRIAETINQAAYIFPAGKSIKVGGLTGQGLSNQMTTGLNGLALLVPDGRSPVRYHGVIFYLADRTKFLNDLPNLPSNRVGPRVLVEARTGNDSDPGELEWPRNSLPNLTWAASIKEGVLVDGMLEEGSGVGSGLGTNLMRSASFSPQAGIDSVFATGLRANTPVMTDANALLLGIGFQLSLRISPTGQTVTSTPSSLIPGLGTARNVPRR
jgi:prepilin-type N-terminal cleavage/methylation domain-containing protein